MPQDECLFCELQKSDRKRIISENDLAHAVRVRLAFSGLVQALPDRVGLADGACIGIPALTAHRALFSDSHQFVDQFCRGREEMLLPDSPARLKHPSDNRKAQQGETRLAIQFLSV
jgi:hypothetical protein